MTAQTQVEQLMLPLNLAIGDWVILTQGCRRGIVDYVGPYSIGVVVYPETIPVGVGMEFVGTRIVKRPFGGFRLGDLVRRYFDDDSQVGTVIGFDYVVWTDEFDVCPHGAHGFQTKVLWEDGTEEMVPSYALDFVGKSEQLPLFSEVK